MKPRQASSLDPRAKVYLEKDVKKLLKRIEELEGKNNGEH